MDTRSSAPVTGAAVPAKVPEITIAFWVVKILTTGLGETTSDFTVRQYDPRLVIPVAGLALASLLLWQWLSPKYSKWRYWCTVALVAIFGTMIADAVHIVLGVPYAVSTAAFAFALVVLFVVWHGAERTLSIHSITTRKREAFYWAAVILTFAFGTAAGDMTATTLGLGYLASGILFLALFLIPQLLEGQGALNEVGAFWASYVLTRPLGASFADWIAVPHSRGGLDLGTAVISCALAVVAVIVVATRRFDPALLRPPAQTLAAE